ADGVYIIVGGLRPPESESSAAGPVLAQPVGAAHPTRIRITRVARIALLFPGQGAQHVGMGRKIAEKHPRARELYDRASAVLGYDLAKKCFEGPAAELDTTEISQPAIFVASLAALEMLKAESPDVVSNCTMAAGLSLGEYT